MRKKFLGLFLMLAILFCPSMLSLTRAEAPPIPTATVNATGSISGSVAQIPNERMRDYVFGQYIRPSNLFMYYMKDEKVQLFDQKSNKVLAETTTGNAGKFTFDDLALDQTYYLKIAPEHAILLPCINARHEKSLETDPITLTAENPKKENIFWGLVATPFSLKTTTAIGSFSQYAPNPIPNPDDKTCVYFPGGIKVLPGDFNTLYGILYGDRISDYKIHLQAPTLSAGEKAYGYKFEGWKRTGGPDKIMDGTEAVDTVVTGDTRFEAVFSHPTNTVTFATNGDYGSIGGKTEVGQTFEGNASKVTAIPTVTPKPGYAFIGWYKDLTMNVIPVDTIKNTLVNGDISYYAKYKVISPDARQYRVSFDAGTNGRTLDQNSITVNDGDYIPAVPEVAANEGKIFVGWSKGDKVYADAFSLIRDNIVRSDLHFAAVYKAAPSAPTAGTTTGTTASMTTGTTTKLTQSANITQNDSNNSKAAPSAQNLPKTGETSSNDGLLLGSATLLLSGLLLLIRKWMKRRQN